MHVFTDMDSPVRHGGGFALPTVLIASVVMLGVLVITAASVSSIRTSMNSQYYQQLAFEAAESGVVAARMCLEQSNNLVTWSDAQPLMPNTDCAGTVT